MARAVRASNDAKHEDGTIETTLGAIVDAWPALGRIAGRNLPILVAYHVKTLCRLLEPEAEKFNECRLAAVKELGRKRKSTEAERADGWEDEITVVEQGPNKVEFIKRINALRAQKVTVRAFPVPLALLGDADMTAADLLVLEPFVNGAPPTSASQAAAK